MTLTTRILAGGALFMASLLVLSTPAAAAIFSVGVLDEETDIIRGVETIAAANFGGTGTVTVNGVVHPDTNLDYSPIDFFGPFGDPDPSVFTGDFFDLMDGIVGTNQGNEPGTFSIPVEVGKDYLFQAYWLVKDNFQGRTFDITFEGDSLVNITANRDTREAVLLTIEYVATDPVLNVAIASDPDNVWLQGFSLQRVPEPSALALAALGLLALGFVGWRSRKRA